MGIPENDGALTIATITITSVLDDVSGVCTWTEAVTPDGEDVPLVHILGMFELAKDTFIRQAMGNDDA